MPQLIADKTPGSPWVCVSAMLMNGNALALVVGGALRCRLAVCLAPRKLMLRLPPQRAAW
eukprot:scaffold7759_cov119-Isochrysis_galbana.AAC.9